MLNLFPFTEELSGGIEEEQFILSHLHQPDLFIRLRPGHETTAKEKLQKDGIIFNQVSDTCLALPNSTDVDKIIELNKEAVIQDYSSQRTAELLLNLKSKIANLPTGQAGGKFKVWDCCAASGGKSIMLYDLYANIELTVSDLRDSILNNLKKRFSQAGIKRYESFVKDLTATHSPFSTHHSRFDLIICDAPCSGSGTWGRTPEQLIYFEKSKIDYYASIQEKIVSNVYAHLKAGGYLLYITCSVYKKENEEVVNYMRQNLKLELIQGKLLKGYHLNADTMFAALLRKQL
jgi:16S rRNA (cytosine967-C5)-methyltransferase